MSTARATARAGTAALRSCGWRLLLMLLLSCLLLTSRAIAAPLCGAQFVYPLPGLHFFHLDTLNVTYRTGLSHPSLSCWCGEPGRATEKYRVDNAAPFGSQLVVLNFSASDTETCWFQLQPNTGDCEDVSPSFSLLPDQRPGSVQTVGLLSTTTVRPSSTATITANPSGSPPDRAVPASDSSPTGTLASPNPPKAEDSLSPGAKAGIGIGVALIGILAGAMAAFLYFRRKKKPQHSDLADAIIDHDRRHGRRGPEKGMGRNGTSSVTSGRSDEPLYPQQVFDGFPGSMGYDDVRSLHSTDAHSPIGPHSPNLSNNPGFWGAERSTERDELTAARLNSKPIVTSYGPNPVTPTLTPRPSAINVRVGSRSLDGREGVPPMPDVPIMPDYITFSIPPPSAISPTAMSEPAYSPPKKAALPIVVSYGPNRVTPTPVITSPTVPPDETIFKRGIDTTPAPRPITAQDRAFSWELDDAIEPMGPSSMGPLPPYASTADFSAMEKGAIRKLAAPQAEAELPPTKDGFYHDASDIVEYELAGAAPMGEPQRPYHLQQYKRHPEAETSGMPARSGGLREIDEQKFLLLPEISNMRAQKVKARGGVVRDMEGDDEDEEYDLGERPRR